MIFFPRKNKNVPPCRYKALWRMEKREDGMYHYQVAFWKGLLRKEISKNYIKYLEHYFRFCILADRLVLTNSETETVNLVEQTRFIIPITVGVYYSWPPKYCREYEIILP